jgi:hypothetical protein
VSGKGESVHPGRRARPFVHVELPDFGDGISIYAGYHDDDGNRGIIRGDQVEWLEPGEALSAERAGPSVMLNSRGHGQQLIDELWRNGLRPSVAVSSVGQAEALQANLADLRGIADRLLKIVERP